MEKYKLTKSLGDGTYGRVVEALNLETKEKVAIKQMKQDFETWEECINLREIKSLRKLNHPNIVRLREVLKVKQELFLVFEHMDVNLYEYYLEFKDKKSHMPEQTIKQLIFQTAQGLAYMHKHGYFHRDLKPENLLISADRHSLKICDFGLARETRSRPPYTEYVSTRWYRAPELLLKSTMYNSPVDIFALACIMIELYMLNPLWAGQSEIDHLHKLISTLGTPTPAIWPEGPRLAGRIGFLIPQNIPKTPIEQLLPNASPSAIDLLEQMLQYDPMKRPTAMQVLKHPYFTGQDNYGHSSSQQMSEPSRSLSSRIPANSQDKNFSQSNSRSMKRFHDSDQVDSFKNSYENEKMKPTYKGSVPVEDASQFVARETEKINRERNKKLLESYPNKLNYDEQFDGPGSIWNYQIPDFQKQNSSVTQQENMKGVRLQKQQSTLMENVFQNRANNFQYGGLDIISVKNPSLHPPLPLAQPPARKVSLSKNAIPFIGNAGSSHAKVLSNSKGAINNYGNQKSGFLGSSTWNLSEYRANNYDFAANNNNYPPQFKQQQSQNDYTSSAIPTHHPFLLQGPNSGHSLQGGAYTLGVGGQSTRNQGSYQNTQSFGNEHLNQGSQKNLAQSKGYNLKPSFYQHNQPEDVYTSPFLAKAVQFNAGGPQRNSQALDFRENQNKFNFDQLKDLY